MKILQIIYSLDLGGIEEFTDNLAGCFAAEGFDSHILLLSRGRDKEWCAKKRRHIEAEGTSVTDISGQGRLRKLFKMTGFINGLKPDVVIIHHELNTLRVFPARVFYKFAIIQIQHNTKINGTLRHRLFAKYLVNAYAVPSVDVAEAVSTILKIPLHEVKIIENGIPLKEFKPGSSDNSIITILSAGRFVRQKNLVELAGIFKEFLSGEIPVPAKIHMVGEGEYLDRAKDIAAGNIGISFPGAVYDLRPFYQEADIYVSYSLHEGLSLTLLEAMASGCAILSTATSGTRDVIKNGQNGILVDINDRVSFLKELNRLAGDKALRKSLAAGAVKTAADYDFAKTYGKYRNLIESLVSNE